MFLKEENTELLDADILAEETGVEDQVNIQDESDYVAYIQESEEAYGILNGAIMRAEHKAVMTEDTALMEAAIGDYWDSVVTFFKKVWEAVKQFFRNVWMRIEGLWMNRVKWVTKYSGVIAAGEAKLIEKKHAYSQVKTGEDSISKLVSGMQKIVGDAQGKNYAADVVASKIEAAKSAVRGEAPKMEKSPLTSGGVAKAVATVKELANAKSQIRAWASMEIKAAKEGISIAKKAKNKTEDDKTAAAWKTAIKRLRSEISLARLARSKTIAITNTLSGAAFSLCKSSASAGARSSKTAFKKGKSVKNEETTLSQFMDDE